MSNKPKRYYKYFYTEKYLSTVVERNLNYSTASGIDNMNYDFFNNNKKEIISDIKKKVLSNNYSFSSYKELLIVKDKKSKPRCISIPTIKDRVCLRSLAELLNNYFDDIPKQCIPQKHISKIQRNIDKYDSYLKLDLSNFYGNIDHDLLLKKLKRKIKSPVILELITKAIKNPTGKDLEKETVGIPQGIPISNILAHIFLSELDMKYEEKEDLMYCRYVDDILIFCNKDKFKETEESIIKELTIGYKLKLNTEKKDSGLLRELTREAPLNFLGYTFFRSQKCIGETMYITSVRKESRLAMERKIISLLNNFNKDRSTTKKNLTIHELNRLITGSISREIDNDINKIKRFGWLFFYSQINDETLLWHLDIFVENKINDLMKKPKNQNLKIYIGEIIKKKKSFVRTYYEIIHNFEKTNYIFNPDGYSETQKIEFLNENFGISIEKIRKMTPKELDRRFKSYVYRKIKRDEKDLIKIVAKSD